MPRDNFSEPTKRLLAARVGHTCSFLDCGRLTIGPKKEAGEFQILGNACHITAASENGPRYDDSLTPGQRSHYDNGIWMCPNHARLIDNDDSNFTVEQLRQWKADAVARAAERLRSGTAAALVASRLYGVPRTPSAAFVGRADEIVQLRDVLNHSSAVRIAASVEGLPGIGKTELALQLVYQLAHDGTFPGGIFWFDAEDPDLVLTWGGAIADDLGIPEGPVDQRAAASMQQVEEHQEPTLLVFDNVESWSPESKPQPFPRGTHIRYLVTTRQRHLGGSAFEKHVEVGFLDDTIALELLERLAGRQVAYAPGLAELVEHLGGHALAVELAGAFLGVYSSETPASYLAELKANSDEIEGEVADDVRYRRTVSQAFATFWDRLDDSVRQAWQLAACFEPEPVTDELSEAVGLSRKSQRQLQRLHLIEVDGEGRWWMHRLTREFGYRAGSEESLHTVAEAFVKGCAEFANRLDLANGFWLYRRNRAHLDVALAAAPKLLDGGKLSKMQDRIGAALQSSGDLSAARQLREKALASALEHLGGDHIDVADRRNDLGWLLREQGDFDGARELLELALASGLKHFGENHPEVAARRSNLGTVLQAQGDLSGARELLELALTCALEHLGDENLNVATARSNLAVVLKEQGDLDGARELLELALASDLSNFGGDHPYVALDRMHMGTVLCALGHLDEASSLLKTALAAFIDKLGEEHPHVAKCRAHLASVEQALREQT